ncbi:hypothetical protein [Companilactobacillus musae]|uniref:hypothetical protein n=1 Tax=Companilactobacillus musae TaxID=1903258 RepID=UPI0013C33AF8|nr:hypothetical protein [Companilactobacillus musae]
MFGLFLDFFLPEIGAQFAMGYAPGYPKASIKLRLEGNKGYLKILHTQSSPN